MTVSKESTRREPHSGTSPPSRSEMNKSEFIGRIVAEVLMTIEFSRSELSKALEVYYKLSSEGAGAAVYGGDSRP